MTDRPPSRRSAAGPPDRVSRLATDSRLIAGGLAATAIGLVLLVAGEPRLGVAVPAAFVGTVVAVRRIDLVLAALLLLIGFQGTLTAFTPLPVSGAINLGLVIVWLAALWLLLVRRERGRLWLWPGVVALSIYPLLSVPAIGSAESLSLGFESWRLSSWHLLAFLALAIAPWPPGTFRRFARAAVVVFLAVAAYCVFRKLTGSAADELTTARAYAIGLPRSEPVPFFGSFFTAQDLAAWMGGAIPFAMALALAWRGRWRLFAAAAAGLSTFALLAADRRAAFVGAVLGAAVVLALFALAARAFGGRRLGIALVSLGATVVLGSALYSVTIARSPESLERFEGLVENPTGQQTYQIRVSRWALAWESAQENPLGVGLGNTGATVARRQTTGDQVIRNLDSSYVKIAYEQGFAMLAVFAFGLLTLLFGLAWRGASTPRPQVAALTIGACGTLTAAAVLLYTSFFIESLVAVMAWTVAGVAAAQFSYLRTPATARLPRARRGRPLATGGEPAQ